MRSGRQCIVPAHRRAHLDRGEIFVLLPNDHDRSPPREQARQIYAQRSHRKSVTRASRIPAHRREVERLGKGLVAPFVELAAA
jgi:hypothetical protein